MLWWSVACARRRRRWHSSTVMRRGGVCVRLEKNENFQFTRHTCTTECDGNPEFPNFTLDQSIPESNLHVITIESTVTGRTDHGQSPIWAIQLENSAICKLFVTWQQDLLPNTYTRYKVSFAQRNYRQLVVIADGVMHRVNLHASGRPCIRKPIPRSMSWRSYSGQSQTQINTIQLIIILKEPLVRVAWMCENENHSANITTRCWSNNDFWFLQATETVFHITWNLPRKNTKQNGNHSGSNMPV